ncbi:MAG: type I glyceraldehyde-3-phosphate dehydrogenase, partial [Solirubrobacteraceae bacterium]
GVECALMTTVHAYTAGQQLVDGPSRSFPTWAGGRGQRGAYLDRRGAGHHSRRAGARDRFDGIAVRAPIPVGSIADIVFVADPPTADVDEAFRQEVMAW